MLGLQLEHVAEFDVEPTRQQGGGCLKEIAARDARQRLLAEVGNCLLLSCRRAELLLGAARFLDAQPPKPLRAQPDSPRKKGSQPRSFPRSAP